MLNNKKEKLKKVIPVFFSSDKNYLPYLSVAILSLCDHASKLNTYNIYILSSDVDEKDILILRKNIPNNVCIKLVNVSKIVEKIKGEMALRDYYTESIYYRLFIPELFPNFDKAVYLDSDITLNCDIADLFNVELKDNLLGAILDSTVYNDKTLTHWAREALDVDEHHYFNSGVLVMNTKKFREINIKDHFCAWVNKYDYFAIAPDQNYFNCICKNKVVYLDESWNAMPAGRKIEDKNLKLIHYNMFLKPWKYDNVLYEEYFWKYAEKSPYFDEILRRKALVPEDSLEKDLKAKKRLLETATMVANSKNNYKQDLKKKTKLEYDPISFINSLPIHNINDTVKI